MSAAPLVVATFCFVKDINNWPVGILFPLKEHMDIVDYI